MKNRNYEINYATKVITITKRFAKLAQDFSTPEAKEMEMLLEKYPTFAMEYKKIEKKENVEKYNGLSLETMRIFFESRIRVAMNEETVAAAKADLENFQRVQQFLGSKQFAKIKKWFIENYREEYKEWSITKEFNKAA